MTLQLKTRIGNLTLMVWLAAGISGGILLINWIPSYFGDKAGVLLPAYIVALVVILVIGRIVIERLLNGLFIVADAPFLRASTIPIINTGTSFATLIVFTMGAIVTTGLINLEVDPANPVSSDVGSFRYFPAINEDATSSDLNMVYAR